MPVAMPSPEASKALIPSSAAMLGASTCAVTGWFRHRGAVRIAHVGHNLDRFRSIALQDDGILIVRNELRRTFLDGERLRP